MTVRFDHPEESACARPGADQLVGSRLDHVAIHVADRDEAETTVRELLGHDVVADLAVPGPEGHADLRVMADVASRFHLVLCDARAEAHPIARWVDRRGPGIHHLAHRAADLDAALGDVVAAGGRVVGRPTRVNGLRQAFVEVTEDGILHEIIQRDGPEVFDAQNVASLIDSGVREGQ